VSPEAVEGYCRAVFARYGLVAFEDWWRGEDPTLDYKSPEECAATRPRDVIARAEVIGETK
jgi:hypothetical protein